MKLEQKPSSCLVCGEIEKANHHCLKLEETLNESSPDSLKPLRSIDSKSEETSNSSCKGFQCDKCGSAQNSRPALSWHLSSSRKCGIEGLARLNRKYRKSGTGKTLKKQAKYQCIPCGKSHLSYSTFQKHKKHKSGHKPRPRPQKLKEYNFDEYLTGSDQRFYCPKCPFAAEMKHVFEVHLNSKNGCRIAAQKAVFSKYLKDGKYYCPNCHYDHVDLFKLKIHITSPWGCDLWKRRNFWKKDYQYSGTGEEFESRLYCPNCPYSTSAAEKFKEHQENADSCVLYQPRENRRYKCPECDYSPKESNNAKCLFKGHLSNRRGCSVAKRRRMYWQYKSQDGTFSCRRCFFACSFLADFEKHLTACHKTEDNFGSEPIQST